MGYVCAKRMKLGGREFFPGEAIPDGAFAGGRQDKLVSYGYVTELKSEESMGPCGVNAAPVEYVTVRLGEKEIPISGAALQSISDIMRRNAKDAADAISEEVDESVLAFIGACDSRRDVQRAVQKQISVISSLKDGQDVPIADSPAEGREAPAGEDGEGSAEAWKAEELEDGDTEGSSN